MRNHIAFLDIRIRQYLGILNRFPCHCSPYLLKCSFGSYKLLRPLRFYMINRLDMSQCLDKLGYLYHAKLVVLDYNNNKRHPNYPIINNEIRFCSTSKQYTMPQHRTFRNTSTTLCQSIWLAHEDTYRKKDWLDVYMSTP